jgi:hypothetical protein
MNKAIDRLPQSSAPFPMPMFLGDELVTPFVHRERATKWAIATLLEAELRDRP